jgi:hypothetical protein
VTFEPGGIVLFKFPGWHTTPGAHPDKPLVTQPPGRPAVQGVVNDKRFITVGDQTGCIPHDFNGFNSVKLSGPGGPQFDLVDQVKNSDPFAEKPFFDRFTNCFV